jgi:hypothetical protein
MKGCITIFASLTVFECADFSSANPFGTREGREGTLGDSSSVDLAGITAAVQANDELLVKLSNQVAKDHELLEELARQRKGTNLAPSSSNTAGVDTVEAVGSSERKRRNKKLGIVLFGLSEQHSECKTPDCAPKDSPVDYRLSKSNYQEYLFDHFRDWDVDVVISTNAGSHAKQVLEDYMPAACVFSNHGRFWKPIDGLDLLQGMCDGPGRSAECYDGVIVTRFDLLWMQDWDTLTIDWSKLNLAADIGGNIDDNLYVMPGKLVDQFKLASIRFGLDNCCGWPCDGHQMFKQFASEFGKDGVNFIVKGVQAGGISNLDIYRIVHQVNISRHAAFYGDQPKTHRAEKKKWAEEAWDQMDISAKLKYSRFHKPAALPPPEATKLLVTGKLPASAARCVVNNDGAWFWPDGILKGRKCTAQAADEWQSKFRKAHNKPWGSEAGVKLGDDLTSIGLLGPDFAHTATALHSDAKLYHGPDSDFCREKGIELTGRGFGKIRGLLPKQSTLPDAPRAAVCIVGQMRSLPAAYINWRDGPLLPFMMAGGAKLDFFYVGPNSTSFDVWEDFINGLGISDDQLHIYDDRLNFIDDADIQDAISVEKEAFDRVEKDGSVHSLEMSSVTFNRADFPIINDGKYISGLIQMYQTSKCGDMIADYEKKQNIKYVRIARLRSDCIYEKRPVGEPTAIMLDAEKNGVDWLSKYWEFSYIGSRDLMMSTVLNCTRRFMEKKTTQPGQSYDVNDPESDPIGAWSHEHPGRPVTRFDAFEGGMLRIDGKHRTVSLSGGPDDMSEDQHSAWALPNAVLNRCMQLGWEERQGGAKGAVFRLTMGDGDPLGGDGFGASTIKIDGKTPGACRTARSSHFVVTARALTHRRCLFCREIVTRRNARLKTQHPQCGFAVTDLAPPLAFHLDTWVTQIMHLLKVGHVSSLNKITYDPPYEPK